MDAQAGLACAGYASPVAPAGPPPIDLNVALWGLPAIPGLRGRLTQLRAAGECDAAALFRMYADPRVVRHGARAPMHDLVEATRLMAELRADFERRERIAWVITGTRDDLAIGTCTLFHFDARRGHAEIGYALDAAYWRRGLAGDAVSTVLDWSRRALGLQTVGADVDPANLRSQALLGRLGFSRLADEHLGPDLEGPTLIPFMRDMQARRG